MPVAMQVGEKEGGKLGQMLAKEVYQQIMLEKKK